MTSNDPKRSAVLSKVNLEVKEPIDEISESLLKHGASFDSADSKIDSQTLSNPQQSNITSNQEKNLQGSNFTTLGKIPEQEKIQIIQTGFQFQQQGKISLKKYYESTNPNSLFQLKGYSIKYESIRRTKLYQQFKE